MRTMDVHVRCENQVMRVYILAAQELSGVMLHSFLAVFGRFFVVCRPAHVLCVMIEPHLLTLCVYHHCTWYVSKSDHESVYLLNRSYPA